MLDLRKHLQASRKELRKFGLVFSGIMTVIAFLLAWRGSPAWPAAGIAGVGFLVLALAIPESLRLFYALWMTLGALLAWVNTRVVLGVMYYLVMTPIGHSMKLAGKDILGQKIDRDATTYWLKRPPEARDRRRYEQMF